MLRCQACAMPCRHARRSTMPHIRQHTPRQRCFVLYHAAMFARRAPLPHFCLRYASAYAATPFRARPRHAAAAVMLACAFAAMPPYATPRLRIQFIADIFSFFRHYFIFSAYFLFSFFRAATFCLLEFSCHFDAAAFPALIAGRAIAAIAFFAPSSSAFDFADYFFFFRRMMPPLPLMFSFCILIFYICYCLMLLSL